MKEKLKQRLAILNLFTKAKKEVPKTIHFENTAKTDKGIALYYDELVAGQPIFQQDPQGMLVPAPEGEHMLEDGTKVVIELGSDGVTMIKEVVPATAPATTPEQQAETPTGNGAPNDAAAKTRIRSVIEEVRFTVDPELDYDNTCQALTECIKVLQNELKEKEEKFSKEKKLVEDENASLKTLLEDLSKPASEVTHQPKKSKFLKGYTDEKIESGTEVYARVRKLNK